MLVGAIQSDLTCVNTNMKNLSILICLLLSGCLVMSNNEQKITGKYVADTTWNQIEPGKTTASWIKATLGDPSETTDVPDSHSEVWKYHYTERKQGSGEVFLIFGGNSVKEKAGTAFIEMKDGVVTNKWRG